MVHLCRPSVLVSLLAGNFIAAFGQRPLTTLLESCLDDAACARRLGDSATTLTNGSSTEKTFDLPKRHPKLVELMEPDTPPVFHDFKEGDVVIGTINPTRMASYVLEGSRYMPTWSYSVLFNTALLAWENGLVIEAPAKKAPQRIHPLFADNCKISPWYPERYKCSVPYSLNLLDAMVKGAIQNGSASFSHSFPQARLVLGGGLNQKEIALLAGTRQVPFLGFVDALKDLSDKDKYPAFFRANPPETQVFGPMLEILKYFNYTLSDMVTCGGAAGVGEFVTEIFAVANIRLQTFKIGPGTPNGQLPGTPGYVLAAMLLQGLTQDKAEVQSESTRHEFDVMVANMKALNAHAHVYAMSTACPSFDAVAYLAMEGLWGPGHFWIGQGPPFNGFFGAYAEGMELGKMLLGYGPFLSVRTFDGYLACDEAPDPNRPRFKQFWELNGYIGRNMGELVDDAAMPYDPFSASYFADPTAIHWLGTYGYFFVDAVFTGMLAINSALLKYGPGFTDEQLYQEGLALDFEGITGRVRFTKTGDRIMDLRVVQCNYPTTWEKHERGKSCELTDVASYSTALQLTGAPFRFWNMSTAIPPDTDLKCKLGQRYNRTTGQCSYCSAGQYTAREGMAYCDECAPGSYSDVVGASGCRVCPEGSSSGRFGMTACKVCAAGLFTDQVQQSECRPCSPGQFSGPGAKGCDLCPLGSYSNQREQTSCRQCPNGLTTLAVGSTSEDACVCQEGTYRDAVDNMTCHTCPGGMRCKIGSDEANIEKVLGGNTICSMQECTIPEALPGYMMRTSEPLRPYMCYRAEQCPGGMPGTCAEHRDQTAVACGRCEANARESGKGPCVRCAGSGDILPFIFVPILVIIAMAILVVSATSDKILQQRAMLALSLVLTVTVSSLQTLAMFPTLSMTWFQPVGGTAAGLSILQLDVDILRVSCGTEVTALGKYIMRSLIPLVLLFVALVVLHVKKCIIKDRCMDMLVEFSNAVGSIYSALFISMVCATFVPYVCYYHPDGTQSMLANPDIKCYEGGEHTSIVVVAVLSFLACPLPYLAMVVYATVRFESSVKHSMVGNSRMLSATRFLHSRFTPECYFYSLSLMARSLLICLIPVVIRKDPAFQLIILALVLIVFHVLQMMLQPWLANIANRLEGAMNGTLLLIIVCGAAGTDFRAEASSIKALGTALLVSGVIIVAWGFIYAATHRFRAFQLHHLAIVANKRENAALTRLLKLLLAKRGKVALSDDMYEPDLLLDVIKSAVEHVVVFLTKQSLSMPLVAAQVAVACAKKLPVYAVQFKSFVKPCEEDFKNISGYLCITGIALAQFSISWDRIEKGYRYLMSAAVEKVDMRNVEAREWQAISGYILESLSFGSESPAEGPRQGQVLISVDPTDDEALAVAGIMTTKLRECTNNNHFYVLCKDTDYPTEKTVGLISQSSCMFVVLTFGSLSSRLQMQAVVQAAKLLGGTAVSQTGRGSKLTQIAREQLTAVTRPSSKGKKSTISSQVPIGFSMSLVITPSFTFPDDDAYEEVFGYFPGVCEVEMEVIRHSFEQASLRIHPEGLAWDLDMQMQLLASFIPSGDALQASTPIGDSSNDGTNQSCNEVDVDALQTMCGVAGRVLV